MGQTHGFRWRFSLKPIQWKWCEWICFPGLFKGEKPEKTHKIVFGHHLIYVRHLCEMCLKTRHTPQYPPNKQFLWGQWWLTRGSRGFWVPHFQTEPQTLLFTSPTVVGGDVHECTNKKYGQSCCLYRISISYLHIIVIYIILYIQYIIYNLKSY